MNTNQDSLIKWQLSEQTIENFLKNNGTKITHYVRHSPTGVNAPNIDFSFSINNENFFVELKNHYYPLVKEFIVDNILPKFLETQSNYHQKARWIIITPRMYEPAKEVCKSSGIEIIEFKKQLVTKKQWKKYCLKKQKHSTASINLIFRLLHHYFFGRGSKVSLPSYSPLDSLIVQDNRGDCLFFMKNGKIDQDFPYLHKLNICDQCGELFQGRDVTNRFCSMHCFHKWGGPKRIVRENS